MGRTLCGLCGFLRRRANPSHARQRVWLVVEKRPFGEWILAIHDGKMVGITHYRVFSRPLAAATGLFLDDLFVTPDARSTGVAGALIDAVCGEAKANGHSVVRWIIAEDNARARGLYDKIADQTEWVTYDIKV